MFIHQVLGTTEATETFFAITKLFQVLNSNSKGESLKRSL